MHRAESENSSYDATRMRELQEEMERAASAYEAGRSEYEGTYETVTEGGSSLFGFDVERPIPVSTSQDRFAKAIVDLYDRWPVRLAIKVVLLVVAIVITMFGLGIEVNLETGAGVMHTGFPYGDIEFAPVGEPKPLFFQFMGVWALLGAYVLLFPKIDMKKIVNVVLTFVVASFFSWRAADLMMHLAADSAAMAVPHEQVYPFVEAITRQLEFGATLIEVVWIALGMVAVIAKKRSQPRE